MNAINHHDVGLVAFSMACLSIEIVAFMVTSIVIGHRQLVIARPRQVPGQKIFNLLRTDHSANESKSACSSGYGSNSHVGRVYELVWRWMLSEMIELKVKITHNDMPPKAVGEKEKVPLVPSG